VSLPVNPLKVLRLFGPLWVLLAISLWVHWDKWQSMPILFTAIALLPLGGALAAALMRERWRLELAPDALIHHTLARTERYEWARMGPLTVKPSPLPSILFVQTFWFAFPLDEPRTIEERMIKPIGKRILCVFGDHAPAETIRQIEDWRALYAGHVKS
jgi:hypothetical protein